MKLLNVGCGVNVYDYAQNIDIDEDRYLKIYAGDAYKLDTEFDLESVDVIYMLCPYDYYPLRSKAFEVLKPSGLLIITGTYSNPYFLEVWLSSETFLNKLGFDTYSKKQSCHPEFYNSYTSEGKPIAVNTLKQIVLRKR